MGLTILCLYVYIGAVGDPASLGVFAVLLGQSDGQYLAAAQREIDFILSAPRWPNGAISHRIEAPELWYGKHANPSPQKFIIPIRNHKYYKC